MKLIKFLMLFVLAGSLMAQESLEKNVTLLFPDSTATRDSNGMYYITLNDADTVTSGIDVVSDGRRGNIRLSALVDTTSGSTKVYIDLGVRVFSEGTTSTRNVKWFVLDSLEASDDGVPITKQLSEDFSHISDPGIGYYYRLRQTGTQVNRIYFSRIVFREKTR